MKRDAALAALSRDHHQALFVAQTLGRATASTAGDARRAFLDYWDEYGDAHFRVEEDVLLPAYAAHGDAHHPLVARALCEHVEIRYRADAVRRDCAPAAQTLHTLGSCLSEHVRLEERQLFPLIEEAMPDAELANLGVALEEAERRVRVSEGTDVANLGALDHHRLA
jgi:hemerythrin-like domain-containing protein